MHCLLQSNPSSLTHTRAVITAAAYDSIKSLIGPSDFLVSESGVEKPANGVGGTVKKVFVSYAWEPTDPQHQTRVLKLTNQLRQYGFDATMDILNPSPPEGLPMWMMSQIRHSDYVLMVITETYRKRCEGDEEFGIGKGVKWEGGIITRAVYQAEFHNRKFLPVLLGGASPSSIPSILIGNAYFNVSTAEGLEGLVRLMSDQPAYVASPLGRTPVLPPRNEGGTNE